MIKLQDICSKGTSSVAQKDLVGCDGDYPIYGASGFIKNVNFYHQEEPCVAVVKDGAGVGRVIKLPKKSSVIGTMQYIIPNKGVEVGYLAYVLESLNLSKYYSGATIPHIYFKDYGKALIKEHTLEEQKRITEILDLISSNIDKRKEQLSLFDQLVKSRFIEMFGDVHESGKYPYKAIKEVTNVVSGGTPSRTNNDYWNNGSVPWIKTTELKNNVIITAEEFITERGLMESSAKLVPAGTILVAMYGQGKTRGMTGYLSMEASTNQACACILPSDKIYSMYLWKYLEFSYDKLRNLAQGGGQPNLNGEMIKNFKILLPPREMQEKFVDFVAQVDKSKLAVQKSIDELETLKKSLMQEYFG
ncbi:restriction endonuclease subunit S [Phascolarctobacterium sp.]|uniref:restriction endonuclease subunit S n=1 Tax=Phascolarctobacterium sp. TaxID=2049039 RepID=UPI00386AF00F